MPSKSLGLVVLFLALAGCGEEHSNVGGKDAPGVPGPVPSPRRSDPPVVLAPRTPPRDRIAGPTKVVDPETPKRSNELTELCDLRERYLKARLSSRRSVGAILDRIIDSKTQLLIAAEHHKSPTVHGHGRLFHEARKRMPRLDCLFVELDDSHRRDMEAFLAGMENPREQLLNWFLFMHESLLREAIAHSAKILLVDNDYRFASVTERNGYMTRRMQDHFASGKCHQGYLFTGKAHVSDSLQKPTIPDLLRMASIPTAKVTLVTPPENIGTVELKWKDCRWNPTRSDVGEKSFGFLTPGPSPRSYADEDISGHWHDYDAAMILQKDFTDWNPAD